MNAEPAGRPTPYEARNTVLNIAAASDAAHDFHEVRGNPTFIEKAKSVLRTLLKGTPLASTGDVNFKKMWDTTHDIGTIGQPATYFAHGKEWDLFKLMIGIGRDDIKGHEGEPQRELLVQAGDAVRKYTLDCLNIGTSDDWAMSSQDLFTAIVGSPEETSLYFMVDAVSVNFYDALAADAGSARKIAFYVQTRESDNDAAGKPNLRRLVDKTRTGHVVRVEEIRDEYDYHIVYPPLSAGPAEPNALFNSVYTVTLESSVKTKTKEGLRTVITKFQHPEFQAEPVVVQKGVAEEQHPNAVNSIFPTLARIYRAFRGPQPDPKARFKYWALLQQKRSGDWLQALACLDTNRFIGKAVPKGMPIFLATEDIICAAYALFVGVNVIFTYHYDGKKCLAVFRASAERPSRDVLLKARIAQANLLSAPIVGRLTYGECMEAYTSARAQVLQTLLQELETACAAVRPQRTVSDRGMRSTDRVFANRNDVDNTIRRVLEVYAKALHVLHTMPALKGEDDDAWEESDAEKLAAIAASPEELSSAEFEKAQRLYDQAMSNCAVLRALNANGDSPDRFRVSMRETIATVKPRLENLSQFSIVKPFEEIPPRVLGLIQSLDSEMEPRLLTPLKGVFGRLNAELAEYRGSDRNQYVDRVATTVKSIEYLIFKEQKTIPTVERPTDAGLMTRIAGMDTAGGMRGSGDGEERSRSRSRTRRSRDRTQDRPMTRGREALQQLVETFATPDTGAFVPIHRILVYFKRESLLQRVDEAAIESLFVRAALGLQGGGSGSGIRSRTRTKTKTRTKTARSRLTSHRRTTTRKRSQLNLQTASHPLVTVWFLIRHLLGILSYGPSEVATRILNFVVRWTEAAATVQADLQLPETVTPLFRFAYFGCLEAILLLALPTLSNRPALLPLVKRLLDTDPGEVQDMMTGFCDTVLGFPAAPQLEGVLKDKRLLPAALRAISTAPPQPSLQNDALRLYEIIPRTILPVAAPLEAAASPRRSKQKTMRRTRTRPLTSLPAQTATL